MGGPKKSKNDSEGGKRAGGKGAGGKGVEETVGGIGVGGPKKA